VNKALILTSLACITAVLAFSSCTSSVTGLYKSGNDYIRLNEDGTFDQSGGLSGTYSISPLFSTLITAETSGTIPYRTETTLAQVYPYPAILLTVTYRAGTFHTFSPSSSQKIYFTIPIKYGSQGWLEGGRIYFENGWGLIYYQKS